MYRRAQRHYDRVGNIRGAYDIAWNPAAWALAQASALNATIDKEFDAMDIARGIACQERDNIADLFRLADAAKQTT